MTKNLDKIIGERIRLRREQLGMTQDQLAQRAGYKSRTSINKIEAGVQSLTQPKIKPVADALMTTPDYIMSWDDETMPESHHCIAEDVAADGLDDILHEFRPIRFNAFPLLGGANTFIGDGFSAELIGADAGLHIREPAA